MGISATKNTHACFLYRVGRDGGAGSGVGGVWLFPNHNPIGHIH